MEEHAMRRVLILCSIVGLLPLLCGTGDRVHIRFVQAADAKTHPVHLTTRDTHPSVIAVPKNTPQAPKEQGGAIPIPTVMPPGKVVPIPKCHPDIDKNGVAVPAMANDAVNTPGTVVVERVTTQVYRPCRSAIGPSR
jgi:hypothetical protein